MKRKSCLFVLLFSVVTVHSAVAQGFTALNMERVGYFNVPDIGQDFYVVADVWGYEGPQGRFALLARSNDGLSIIDINDPSDPVEVAHLDAIGGDLKDVKVYEHYAVAVEEYGPLQIIDISDPSHPVRVAEVYDYGGAHNVTIHDGMAFLTGVHQGNGGMRILDLSDPTAPVEIGRFDPYYIHDVALYGTTAYASAVYFGFLAVVDVSDPTHPREVGRFSTPGHATHHAWSFGDGAYLLVVDETSGGHVSIWDVSDPASARLLSEYQVSSGTSVHNPFIIGETAYLSYYMEGIRVLDLTDPSNPTELGFFDTNPQNTGSIFTDFWGVFAFDDLILGSNMDGADAGLHLLHFFGENLARLRGRVTSEGQPVAGARVALTLETAAEPIVRETDENGNYAFGALSAGSYTLSVTAFGFAPHTAQMTLAGGEERTLDFSLTPLPRSTVTGSVRDMEGNAVATATVAVLDTPIAPVVTDEAGTFEIPGVPAGVSYLFSARAQGFGEERVEAFVDPEGETVVDFVIGPVYLETFEAGPGAWSHEPTDRRDTDEWHWSRTRNHTDGGEGAFAFSGPGGSFYSNHADGVLRSPSLTIGEGARLSFWQWIDAEFEDGGTAMKRSPTHEGNFAYDGGIVEISTDGGKRWEQLEPDGGYPYEIAEESDNPLGVGTPCFSGRFDWHRVSFDLSAYRGAVILRFRFASDAQGRAKGWYIDDVEVTHITADPKPLPGCGVVVGSGTLPLAIFLFFSLAFLRFRRLAGRALLLRHDGQEC